MTGKVKKKLQLKPKPKFVHREINFRSFLIYGDSWHGKTLLALWLALYYKRVYSNVDFYQRNSLGFLVKRNRNLYTMDDIEKVDYEDEPGLILMDEMWGNSNSRRSMTDANMITSDLFFRWRKKNCNVIWIAQRFMSFDVNGRDLATCILSSHKVGWDHDMHHPIFQVRRHDRENRITGIWRSNTLAALKEANVLYDQMQRSDMDI